jgi:hypothetical protein
MVFSPSFKRKKTVLGNRARTGQSFKRYRASLRAEPGDALPPPRPRPLLRADGGAENEAVGVDAGEGADAPARLAGVADVGDLEVDSAVASLGYKAGGAVGIAASSGGGTEAGRPARGHEATLRAAAGEGADTPARRAGVAGLGEVDAADVDPFGIAASSDGGTEARRPGRGNETTLRAAAGEGADAPALRAGVAGLGDLVVEAAVLRWNRIRPPVPRPRGYATRCRRQRRGRHSSPRWRSWPWRPRYRRGGGWPWNGSCRPPRQW